jgi:hypothetical protein
MLFVLFALLLMVVIIGIGVFVWFYLLKKYKQTKVEQEEKEPFVSYRSIPSSVGIHTVNTDFTLANNFCSPNCCGQDSSGGLSCSHGCICLKPDQKALLKSRGNNSAYYDEF